jgi:antitoxin ParD1/3/4
MLPMSTSPDLTTLNVSLPRSQREFVEAEVRRTGCTTTSEYVRRLIAEAQKRTTQERLDAFIIQGLDSGPSEPFTEGFFESLREKVRRAALDKKKEDKNNQ